MPSQAERAQTAQPSDRYLSAAIFFFFIVFAVLLPYSIKGARYAWMAAFLLWLVKLLVTRKRMFDQPLVWPMLAYIVLSGVSCVLSYEPYLSWPQMKVICWVALIGTLFAQNLQRLSQVRLLILLLLLSATSVAGFTAWQYMRGIGVRITSVGYLTPLHRAGFRPDDIIVSISDHSVYSANGTVAVAERIPPDKTVRIRFLRGLPVRRKETFARAKDIATAVKAGTVTLVPAHPWRAQGTLGHWGRLAEVLMPVGCMAWALMLGNPRRERWQQITFALMFLAITATIFTTQTRAALTGLLAGCMVALFFMAPKQAKPWLISALLIMAAAGASWIYYARGLKWIDMRDPGTGYRLLMWQDGARLAMQHPFFGVGMESVQNHWPEWNLQGFARFHAFWNFHSDIIQIAAERGLLALAAWVWFAVAYLIYLVRLAPKIRQQSRFGWAVVIGILAGFVAFLFTSLVESSLGDDSLVMLLFFCFGVAVAIEHMLREPDGIDVA